MIIVCQGASACRPKHTRFEVHGVQGLLVEGLGQFEVGDNGDQYLRQGNECESLHCGALRRASACGYNA